MALTIDDIIDGAREKAGGLPLQDRFHTGDILVVDGGRSVKFL